MSYVEETLLSGERVMYTTRIHPYVFAWPTALGFVGVVMLLIDELSGLGELFTFIAVIGFVYVAVRRATSEFAITDRRVLLKTGVFSRRSLELFLNKVEGIRVDQDLSGRVFGFGTVVVGGTGGSREGFEMIPDPLEFRKRLQDQIQAFQPTAPVGTSRERSSQPGKFCTSCGKPLAQENRFCGFCGGPVT